MADMVSPFHSFEEKPMCTFCYRIGYMTGQVVRAAIAFGRTTALYYSQIAPDEESTEDWDELSSTPALVRKGINLKEWTASNLRPVPTPARSSLDPLI
jgi:hypothetical protein